MDGSTVVVIAIVMVAGLVGTIVPVLPGLPVVWAGALLYGVVDGFGTTGTLLFVAITLVAIAGMAASIVLPHRRLAARGAPRSTVLAGLAGGVVGFFVIPVLGLILGAVAAIMAAEYRRTGDGRAAWSSTKSLIGGFGLGILVELSAALTVVGLWVVWVLST